jgi:spore maturation protein CgeB
VAFVVTKNDPATMAGDYFTATELARALAAEFPVECVFVEHDSDVLKHLVGVDALIAMRDDFDPRRIASHEPHMLRIAWVRNWFERFSQRPFVQDFDAIWASSRAGADIIATATGRMVDVVPIATNPSRFGNGLPQADLVSDYCFTGSFWGFNREIIQMLDPAALPYRFLLVGQGWENVPKLAPYSRGPLPYDRMADVYASSRLVIDDANHVTRETGSVNSRVFDALVAGCLVVTNGVRGSQEMFDGRLPTYSSPQELEGLLELYLENEQLRLDTVAELRETVLRHHTYGHRARICWKAFQDLSSRVRIALKIGAPRREDFQEWGDYHYAASLKRALERLGYMVGIDALKEWENQSANADDVVLVLRGLSAYMPKAHQVNLAWVISHPDSIADAELALFDHVFVASEPYAAELSQRLDRAVTPLLQCTDPELFHPDVRAAARKPSLLFVGNSRMELRPIVRDAIAAGLAPEVWGTRWHGLIPERYIMGANIPNRDLASHYRAAAVVLNDHWASMRRHGFISNRVFDVLACGGRLLSDPVEGLTSLFGSLVKTYENPSELATQVATLAAEDASHQAERDRAARQIGKAHSFDARAAIIAECIESHLQQRGRLHVA